MFPCFWWFSGSVLIYRDLGHSFFEVFLLFLDGAVTFALLRSGEVRCHRSSTGACGGNGRSLNSQRLRSWYTATTHDSCMFGIETRWNEHHFTKITVGFLLRKWSQWSQLLPVSLVLFWIASSTVHENYLILHMDLKGIGIFTFFLVGICKS